MLRRVERLRFGSLTGHGSVAQHERIVDLCAASEVDGATLAARELADPRSLAHRR